MDVAAVVLEFEASDEARRLPSWRRMTFAAGYVLALALLAVVLFAIDVLRVDVVALLLLLALVIPGVVSADKALAGFGSDTILILACLFVLTEGVQRTGVVERIGLRLASFGGANPRGFVRLLIVAGTAISAFMSNTVTAAVLVPLAIGGARRANFSAAKVLMPLAFATILSGGVTLISTSTNLVVSGALPSFGLAPLGFFELAPVGMAMSVLGILYLWFVAPKLVPDRGGTDGESDQQRKFSAEVVVGADSKLAGRTLAQLKLPEALEVVIIGIRRGTRRLLRPRPRERLEEGDELVIEGEAAQILSVKDVAGIDIKTDARAEEPEAPAEVRMVEAMVLPRSPMIERTLRERRFQETTGFAVLGIHAANQERNIKNLSRWRFHVGDVVLIQGPSERLELVAQEQGLLPLEDRSSHHPRSTKGPLAALVFVAAMALAATGVLSLPVAFLAGALALVLTRCLLPDEAYAAIDWRILVLIGSMLAFGAAMQESGAAAWLANLVVTHVSPYGPHAVLGAFALLTAILTQPMSNQAAALLVLPVAVESAQRLGIDPRPFAIAVTLAASCSFLTPLEPACLLVWGPGRYRFFDFVRVGGLLTLICLALTIWLVPIFWPLAATP